MLNLGAALCAGAVLAAARGRAVWAGVLLGCALATKQWAALAILPMLLAAPRGSRMRAGGVMAAVAGLLVAPMMIVDPGRFWLAQKSLGLALTYQHTVTASNVWFPFAQSSTGLTPDGGHAITQFSLPSAVMAEEMETPGPGQVLLRHSILAAMNEGAHTFDFGLGDEAFKQRFATGARRFRTFLLH